jgi:hypothetical protein
MLPLLVVQIATDRPVAPTENTVNKRPSLVLVLLGVVAASPAVTWAQTALPERAVRRDIPITNAIRRAMAAGVRDSTGMPGPRYWQLQTDYTINARLDPATQILSGEETVVIHNNSPSEMSEIRLRLDHNLFRPLIQRGSSVPAETTEGMVVTRLVVNGRAVDLTAGPVRRNEPPRLAAAGMDQTLARRCPSRSPRARPSPSRWRGIRSCPVVPAAVDIA